LPHPLQYSEWFVVVAVWMVPALRVLIVDGEILLYERFLVILHSGNDYATSREAK
jgi:hypothetical protein